MPPKRSLQQLDLKDLTPTSRAPLSKHLRWLAAVAGLLLAAYAMLNPPFAAIQSAPTPALELAADADAAAASVAPDSAPENAAASGPRPAASRAAPPANFIPTAPRAAAYPTAADAEPGRPAADADQPPPQWKTLRVRRGDSLSSLFARNGFAARDAYAIANLPAAARLKKIRPGQVLHLAANARGEIVGARYSMDKLTEIHIRKDAGVFAAEVITRAPEIRRRAARVTIQDSLLQSAKRGNLANKTIYGLIDIFAWQVDFHREIHPGDQLSVIFEEHYLEQEKIDDGPILAAELQLGKRRLRAIRFVDTAGNRNYYAPNGDGIQSAFLRSPLKFGRVTSKFTHKRFHPILKKYRPHRGVDYGARTGTPVRSTGDGVVTMARRNGNYGNTIMIRHGQKYTTLYAHLHGFARGIKRGARVAQGQTIGYVGSTGWSTGPHLHYEFRVNGVHRNPLTVELPKSAPVAARDRPAFLQQAADWVAELERMRRVPVAKN